MSKLLDTLEFFSVRGNWHKQRYISAFLCWMGRHDYELSVVSPSRNHAELSCFYYGQIKHSSTS